MKTPVKLSAKSSQYYVIAEHWASDLDFFKIESNFFHHLLDKYANKSASEVDLENLKKLGGELRNLEEERQKIEILVDELLGQIAVVAEDKVPENMEQIETSYTTLNLLLADLIKKYRKLKKELFLTVEKIN